MLLQLFGRCSLLIKNPNQYLSDLIDDCERFLLRSFDGIRQSAMHIYHSALSWTPTFSPTRQLYEGELLTEAKLVNAVCPTWDTCIRTIPVAVGESVKSVVFSHSGALIAAHGNFCVKVFDTMTWVNRTTFDGGSFSSVAFSPDDRFLASGDSHGPIKVWDVQTGTIFRAFETNVLASANLVVFSSCGTMISSGDTDNSVRIWNTVSGGCDCVFQGHSTRVTNICWVTTWGQVASASDDGTVRIWDVQKQMCLKIFTPNTYTVDLASSQDLLLVASDHTVNIYDSQSGDIIHVIKFTNIKHSRFSADEGKVLLASSDSGAIWDITQNRLIPVWGTNYAGGQTTFSPDGTRIASIYGKFVKIWNANGGNNYRESSTCVHDVIDKISISPDEQLITLKSEKQVDILDMTTGQSVFTCVAAEVASTVFSLDSTVVAFISQHYTVHTWSVHTHCHKSITVHEVFHIALSHDGSQLASLSPSHMNLWDLKSEGCLAHLEFDRPLQAQAQISFTTNATCVSVLKNSNGVQSWGISPNHNIDLTRNSIKNSDNTKSWLISHPLTSPTVQRWKDNNNTALIKDPITNQNNCKGTKLPMIFFPTTEEQSNPNPSVPCQFYRCDSNGEWILDQDGRCVLWTDSEWILDQDRRRVLWIPPDERPQTIWNSFKHKKQIIAIQTESGKVYIVNFLTS